MGVFCPIGVSSIIVDVFIIAYAFLSLVFIIWAFRTTLRGPVFIFGLIIVLSIPIC